MKYFIHKETGSIYYIDKDYGGVNVIPMNNDGTFDSEEGGEVEREIMKGEIFFDDQGNKKGFDGLYDHVERVLSDKFWTCFNCWKDRITPFPKREGTEMYYCTNCDIEMTSCNGTM